MAKLITTTIALTANKTRTGGDLEIIGDTSDLALWYKSAYVSEQSRYIYMTFTNQPPSQESVGKTKSLNAIQRPYGGNKTKYRLHVGLGMKQKYPRFPTLVKEFKNGGSVKLKEIFWLHLGGGSYRTSIDNFLQDEKNDQPIR